MSEEIVYKRIKYFIFPYFAIIIIITVLYMFVITPKQPQLYLVLIALLSTLTSLILLQSFYAIARVKGIDRTYLLGPDLALIKEENIQTKIAVSQGRCAECGKEIFKPFRCDDCKKYFCGAHYLQGDHKCIERRYDTLYKLR